ncbi:hypothetical protein [Streptomyces melanogenes]|uniref:hypothetical protein n=1 Tax=Streptomyces melanogenes TaxID=67326 RepID=UPI00167E29E3|nr:hypothetical protein [Streptomyces melanogenes]GGP72105.1 hypothetical protein GCM10010278_57700 [Streptomyces melanogenes]
MRVLHAYLTALPETAGILVSASLVDRVKGQPSVILDGTGGYRVVRHRADRADFTINVYHRTMHEAADLAFALRERLLEDLPGTVVGGGQVLDVNEVHSPVFLADMTSGEYRYIAAIALYLTATTA